MHNYNIYVVIILQHMYRNMYQLIISVQLRLIQCYMAIIYQEENQFLPMTWGQGQEGIIGGTQGTFSKVKLFCRI